MGSPIGRISGSSGAGLGLRSAALTRARTSTSRHQTSTCHVSCTPEIPPEMPPRCRRNVRFICTRIAAAVTSRGRVDRLAARGHTPVRAKVGGRQRGFEASDTYLLRWVRERNRDSSPVPHPSAQLFLPSTRLVPPPYTDASSTRTGGTTRSGWTWSSDASDCCKRSRSHRRRVTRSTCTSRTLSSSCGER